MKTETTSNGENRAYARNQLDQWFSELLVFASVTAHGIAVVTISVCTIFN
jgi:hypothetical protein